MTDRYRSSPARPAATLLLAATLLTACAGSLRGYEQPAVTVTSVRAVPSAGALPDFEIGLRVVNPNRQALPIEGISYSVSLQGNEILTGVGKDFPLIDGYSQEDLTVTASANLFAGMRLFGELLRANRDTVDYAVDARLDLGGFRPTLRVRDEGTLSLSAAMGR